MLSRDSAIAPPGSSNLLFYQIYTLRQFKYTIFVESGSRVFVNSRIVKETTRYGVTSMIQVVEPQTKKKLSI